jgi:hypothetical protein
MQRRQLSPNGGQAPCIGVRLCPTVRGEPNLCASDFWPAAFAAVAAIGSAVAAGFTWFEAQRSTRAAHRPEIVITSWRYVHKNPSTSEIHFLQIRNVGPGVAMHATISGASVEADDGRPMAFVPSGTRGWAMAPGETLHVDGSATIAWNNVPSTVGTPKRMGVRVEILSTDILGNQYTTLYYLHAAQSSDAATFNANKLEEGLWLMTRLTTLSKKAPFRLKNAPG